MWTKLNNLFMKLGCDVTNLNDISALLLHTCVQLRQPMNWLKLLKVFFYSACSWHCLLHNPNFDITHNWEIQSHKNIRMVPQFKYDKASCLPWRQQEYMYIMIEIDWMNMGHLQCIRYFNFGTQLHKYTELLQWQ